MVADVARAMSLTQVLNRLGFDALDEVRRLFAELTDQTLDDQFRLNPPFHTTCGRRIALGRNALINQNCTFYAWRPSPSATMSSSGPMSA